MAKILVIDDEPLMIKIMVRLLSHEGHDVESAQDGSAGLFLMELHEHDLIITDIVMPNKEGIETIIAIRKKSRVLPIIAISGGGKLEPTQYLALALAIGADYAFQKPIDPERFLRAVQKCLSSNERAKAV